VDLEWASAPGEVGLGRHYHGAGRLEEARPELSAAVAMFRDLEMTFWLTRAEAELARAF
jgi:hypothetical protein